MASPSPTTKRLLARLAAVPLAPGLLALGAWLLVPRHRIGAVAVLLDGEQRALLLRHVFHPVAPWGLPGGWVGRGETPAAAAARELREETGLSATVGPLVHVTREIRPRHLTMAFLARADPAHDAGIDLDALRLSGEIAEAGWFAADRLPAGADRYVADTLAAALHHRRGGDPFSQEPLR